MRWRARLALVAVLGAATLGGAPTTAVAANANAVCIGEFISFFATASPPGTIGAFVSGNAHAWQGIGRVVGQEASTDTCGG